MITGSGDYVLGTMNQVFEQTQVEGQLASMLVAKLSTDSLPFQAGITGAYGALSIPFGIERSMYGVSGRDYQRKFGHNAAVGTTEEPIWAESAVSYTYPTGTMTMTLSSSNANDTAAGTGARTIYVEGLDASWNVVSETASLNGQTGVTLANQYRRVYRCYVVSAGSGGVNAGIIYIGYGAITTGKPATVQASVVVGMNQTLQALYTIPNGKTGYLLSVRASANGAGEIRIYTRTDGSVFRIQNRLPIVSDIDKDFIFPVVLPSKTDIEVRGVADVGTKHMGADFEILLV